MITFLFCIFNLFLSVSSFLRKRGKKTISWPFFVQPNFNNGSTHITAFTMVTAAAAAAKSPQSCRTLCDPIDSSPPGSAVHGILQARTLEWVAISFSNAWKWKVKVKSLSRVRPFVTPWTAAFQAPPSVGFSRQEITTYQQKCLLISSQLVMWLLTTNRHTVYISYSTFASFIFILHPSVLYLLPCKSDT